jgi:CheY-like chemotaxis protein
MSTILLLASDPVIRRVICNLLESEGYCVLPASGVGSAVDRLKELTPDLLMVRHHTESLSGHEAAMYLRRVCPGIPVLIVGGILDDVGLENREGLQGFEIFPKPFKAAELLDKVKEVLVKCLARNRAGHNSE